MTGVAQDFSDAVKARRPAALAGDRLGALLACAGLFTLLAACGEENRFVAPPPPKVKCNCRCSRRSRRTWRRPATPPR
jgi:hypothetical protein